jgi:ATP-dependent RNA helicase SUPV3L1/SUV3
MTSLTGASGEDFASILRSLGYRMEQRPKPAEPTPPVTTPGQLAEVADLAASGEEAAVAAEAAPHPAGGDAETDAATPPDIVSDAPLAPVDAPEPEAETATTQEGRQIAGPPSASNEEVELASPSGPLPANGESDIIAAAATPPPPEPILIEVWRPGRPARPEGRRRPRDRHREAGKNRAKGTGEQMQDAGAPAVAAEAAAAAPPAELTAAAPAGPGKPERQARHHRRRGPDQRFERPRREGQRPPHVPRHERQERREKAPDPNSPFAKLAALKAQLEEEAKERR